MGGLFRYITTASASVMRIFHPAIAGNPACISASHTCRIAARVYHAINRHDIPHVPPLMERRSRETCEASSWNAFLKGCGAPWPASGLFGGHVAHAATKRLPAFREVRTGQCNVERDASRNVDALPRGYAHAGRAELYRAAGDAPAHETAPCGKLNACHRSFSRLSRAIVACATSRLLTIR